MNLRKQDLLRVIKEEMKAFLGESNTKSHLGEVVEELIISLEELMSEHNVDSDVVRSALDEFDGRQGGSGDEEWTETPYGAYKPIKEPTMKEGSGNDGDMSMTNRLARAMLDTLTADVQLPEEEKEHYMLTLQDVAQEVLMPMWNEIQQHHDATSEAPIQGEDPFASHPDNEQGDMQRRFESKKRKTKYWKVK